MTATKEERFPRPAASTCWSGWTSDGGGARSVLMVLLSGSMSLSLMDLLLTVSADPITQHPVCVSTRQEVAHRSGGKQTEEPV